MSSPPQDFGRYRLLERIGSGGMASVYRAVLQGEKGFSKTVALKVVREELAADEQFATMFLDEARLAAKLSHANVVQTFDFGHVNGRYFIAMEYVPGKTLALRLRERRGLGVARSVHVAAQVARGLGHAHRLQHEGRPLHLVHRDVSPQNVLISSEGEVKLTDFGIARAAMRSHVTQPGKIRGKCAYMSPEQARGQSLDARTDVFALGVVLWESLTGTRLFTAPSDAEVLAQVIQKEIPAPSRLLPEVPPELDAAVMAMLSRDPAQRPQNGDEAARLLGDLTLRLARSHEDIDLAEPRGDTLVQQDSLPPPRRSVPAAPEAASGRNWDPAAATVAPPAPPPAADLPWSDEPATELSPAAQGGRLRAAVLASLLVAGVALGAWFLRAGQGGAPPPPPAAPPPAAPPRDPGVAESVRPPDAPVPAPAVPAPAPAARAAPPPAAEVPAPSRRTASPDERAASLQLAARAGGASVAIDGKRVSISRMPLPFPCAAGSHVLVFADGAGASCTARVTLAAGETRSLMLDTGGRLFVLEGAAPPRAVPCR